MRSEVANRHGPCVGWEAVPLSMCWETVPDGQQRAVGALQHAGEAEPSRFAEEAPFIQGQTLPSAHSQTPENASAGTRFPTSSKTSAIQAPRR